MKSSSSLGVRETIKFIETEYVNIIHEILKTGKNPFFNDAKLYQNAYTRVQLVADYGEKQCEEMVEYYIQLIEKYIIDCKNKLIEESKSNQSNLDFIQKLNTRNHYLNMQWNYMNQIFMMNLKIIYKMK